MSHCVTALVLIKFNSQRVPGKNFRNFHGKPLFFYVINMLKSVSHIKDIIINTDIPIVKDIISPVFPDIKFYFRPKDLHGDDVSVNVILNEMLPKIEGNFFIQTHVTNPCLQGTTLSSALENYFLNLTQFDSCFAVTKHLSRFYDPSFRPINHDPKTLIQTQDLPPLYEDNSCFYIFSRDTFASHQRIGPRPLLYPISKIEAIDIDSEEDFIMAEQVFRFFASDFDIEK